MKKNQAAVLLGRMGGIVKSKKKTLASRRNGHLGGRPKLNCVSVAGRVRRVLHGSDWRIELFEFVDEFRKNPSSSLITRRPASKDNKIYGLVASMVMYLCNECKVTPPDWASKGYWLIHPYFVGDFQSLKATALLESPIEFRGNNIWVLENFMRRV